MVSGRVRRSEDTYAAFIVYRRTQTAIDSVLAARDSAGPKETTRVFGYQIIAWNAWCKKLGFADTVAAHNVAHFLYDYVLTKPNPSSEAGKAKAARLRLAKKSAEHKRRAKDSSKGHSEKKGKGRSVTIQGVSQGEAGTGDYLGPAGREIYVEDDGVSEDDEGVDKNVATGGGSDIIGGSNIRVDVNGDVVMDQVNNAVDLEATLPEPLSARKRSSSVITIPIIDVSRPLLLKRSFDCCSSPILRE